MRRTTAAVAGLMLLAAGPAAAQTPEFKPLDVDRLVVRPTDEAVGFFSGATRTASRMLARTIDGDGFVKTFNNLFGNEAQPARTQPGLSPLPDPSRYPVQRSPLFHVRPVIPGR